MGKQRNVGREVAWILTLGVVFSIGLYAYIKQSIPEPTPIGLVPTQSATAAAAESHGDAARALATRWGAALASGDYATVHAALARPVRERLSVEALRETVGKHAYLSGTQSITVMRTSEQRIGADPQAFSLRGTGLLASAAGGMEIILHFVAEPDGLHIASVLVAGVPAL